MRAQMVNWYRRMFDLLNKDFFQFLLLGMRLWICHIFLNSAILKVTDWSNTLSLFEQVYKVPYLPYELAARLATIFEFTCSILLLVGLMSRLAVIPLIIMTIVIQMNIFQLTEHYYWLFLMFTIFLYGPGNLSIDYLLAQNLIEKYDNAQNGINQLPNRNNSNINAAKINKPNVT